MPSQVSNTGKAALTWVSKHHKNPTIDMDYDFKSFQNGLAAHFSLSPLSVLKLPFNSFL